MPAGKLMTKHSRLISTLISVSLLSSCAWWTGEPEPTPAPVAVETTEPAPAPAPAPVTTAPAPAPVPAPTATVSSPIMQPDHPTQYVVKKGDTLWDISNMFLRDPWFWPEIWFVNPQVANPHLIYPGDILTLIYIDGKPRLQLERAAGTERRSPRIREESIEQAIPTIPYETISAFIASHAVLAEEELEGLPYILTSRRGHLVSGAGLSVYVRGTQGDLGTRYDVIHVGEPLVDPDDNAVLGYEGIFVGRGRIERLGDPATMLLTESDREARDGDLLIREDERQIPMNFFPRAPERQVEGQIISVIGGVSLIGPYQIVVLNRGARHGLETGHVLTVHQKGAIVRDKQARRAFGEKVQLPDEPAGTVMVFKLYDRASYGLIMRATSEIRVLDKVKNPD